MKFLLIVSVFTLALTSGCKLVYTTSEIQQNLKQTADQFGKNTTKVRKEFQLFTAEYQSFQCESSKSPYTEAERKMVHLNASIKELESINSSVQKEYLDFLNYSKGKKQLTSGTEEWDKLKSTKKLYKSSISVYEDKSELLQKEAAVFQTFVTNTVSPTLKKCDIPSYTKKAKDELLKSEKNALNAKEEIRKYEGQVTMFILNNQLNKAEMCGLVQKEWLIIKDQEPLLAQVMVKLSTLINKFIADTQGKTVIVSCAPDWKVVEKFESDIQKLQSEVNEINTKIKQRTANINALINPPPKN